MSRPEPGGGRCPQGCFHLLIQLATITMIQRLFSLLAFVSVLLSLWLQAPVQAAPPPATLPAALMGHHQPGRQSPLETEG